MTWTIPDFGPNDLLTSEKESFRRVRVDVAQTGFFEGRGAINRTVKREQVDVISVEYADNAAPVVLYPALTKLLAPYLKAGSSGSSFVVSRG